MKYVQTIGLIYLVALNIASLAVTYSDKQQAIKGKWRTPEKHFLRFALCGGGVGVLMGFFMFRHKTRHFGLMAGVIALTVLFYGALISALFLLS